jgi:Domain of unknown function (DUF4386)
VLAWALYALLAPVNRALSLLAAWFRLVYTSVALFAWLNLVTVFHLLKRPDYLTLFGSRPLHAQVELRLDSFDDDGSISLVIFGVHMILRGFLIYRSRYLPRIIGVLLVIDRAGWIIDSLKPYLYPNVGLRFLFVTFLGEAVFMLWLLIRGWKIREP